MTKKISKLTVGDLWDYARPLARIEYINYAPHKDAWNSDKKARNKAKISAENWLRSHNEKLTCGEYFGTRLIITEDKIKYITGQYSPTEIYWALNDYFEKTNSFDE